MTERVLSSGRGYSLSLILAAVVFPGAARAFEFNFDTSCIVFDDCNANAFIRPTDCALDPHPFWCNCTHTVLTNPLRGAVTGVEQGVISILDSPGVGNHRVDVKDGTLDLSGINVGDVIGGTLINELIPEAVGVPPGTFFTLRTEIRVTAKSADGNTLELDNVYVHNQADFIVGLILRYDRFDAEHSDGRLHSGRLTSRGPGMGFVFELRYEKKATACSPAIEPSDAADPGFSTRLVLSLFRSSERPQDFPSANGVYTLPDAASMKVVSTLRMFKEMDGDRFVPPIPNCGTVDNFVVNPAEILPLGAPDLRVVIEEPDPWKEFDEDVLLFTPGANKPPVADICATDINPLTERFQDNRVFIDCGEGRVILRGSNSTDGDGGSQGLTFLWEVVTEPQPGTALIPPETVTFMDVEVSLLLPGLYTIRLTVNDGQAANNIDVADIVLEGKEGFGPNLPPEITSLTYRPDGTNEVELLGGNLQFEVELVGGTAQVIDLDADTTTGGDGCEASQDEIYLWESVSGPAAVVFSDPLDDDTDVAFTATGEYVLRLTVDDGAPQDNVTTIDVTVVVVTPGAPFVRGDADSNGQIELTDGIVTLTFLFVDSTKMPACFDAADADDDGVLSITDGIRTLQWLFVDPAQVPFPPSPRPGLALYETEDCAVDPSAEDPDLGCETLAMTCQ